MLFPGHYEGFRNMKTPTQRKGAKAQGIVVKLSSADRSGRDFNLLMPASTDLNKLLAMLASAEALDWNFDGVETYFTKHGTPKVKVEFAEHRSIATHAEHLARQEARRKLEAAEPVKAPKQ